MHKLECPYCEKEMREPDECHDPDVNYEKQCPHCEKYFVFTVGYIKTFDADKAPCLNGGDHGWKPIIGAPAEYFKGRFRCIYCGDEEKREV